jgi:hypothetical protein
MLPNKQESKRRSPQPILADMCRKTPHCNVACPKVQREKDTPVRLRITIKQKKKGCEVEYARALVLKVEQK